MGQVRCEAPKLPARPQSLLCIADGHGGGGCFDPRANPSTFPRSSIENFVCTPSQDDAANEEWIQQVITQCKGR